MISDIELKSCPFCGKLPHLIKTHCIDNGFNGYHVSHMCTHMLETIRTSTYDSAEEAVGIWNRRENNGQEQTTDR